MYASERRLGGQNSGSEPLVVRIISISVLLGSAAAFAQAQPKAQALIDEVFPAPRGPHASVLLLGTFHFKDAGLDDYKPQHQIDVLTSETQAEIEAIVESLVAFRPTKVAVERRPESAGELDEHFSAYVRGDWSLPENELYQVGFRVAKACGHERVYPVDAPGRSFEPRVDITEFAKEHDQQDLLRNPYVLSFGRLARRMDELKVEQPLRDHLLLMNDPAMLAKRQGIYLERDLGVREGDAYPGADGFVSQWYNRNLRIYGNLQRITEAEDERILVIIGAGHVPILRHLVECSPNMTLVEVADVL